MIEELRPYPEVKDSGSAWLSTVPRHWEIRSLRALIRPRNERNRADLPLLSVARERGVFVRSDSDDNHNVIPDDLSNYKVAKAGSLVVNKMKAWQGSMGIAPCDGIVSPAYFVFDLKVAAPRYAEALFRSKPYVGQFARASDGVRIGQWDLSIAGMKAIPVVLPPPDEQALIVRFLDHATGKIDRAIRAKRRVIALLNEQKRTIIHHAVTCGLDPSVRLKDTSVPWLGKIPAHWNVCRVKNLFLNLNSRRVPLSAVERGAMKLRLYDYYGASGIIDKVDEYLFDDDLILLAEDGANLVLRNLPLAIIARGKFWVNNHAHILKPRLGVIEYLADYLEALSYRPWITGAAQPKLTQDRLMSISVAVAPEAEQVDIVSYINVETGPLRQVIRTTEREVGLLREYRARLIADVVTGKLDVRAPAALLPMEAAASEVVADGELTVEDDVLAEEAA
jgi:type I restriction enzyme, S subunit